MTIVLFPRELERGDAVLYRGKIWACDQLDEWELEAPILVERIRLKRRLTWIPISVFTYVYDKDFDKMTIIK